MLNMIIDDNESETIKILKLQLLLAQEKLKQEQEATKRKQEEEITKRKQIEEEENTKRKALEIMKLNEELRKRMKESFENESYENELSSTDDGFLEYSSDSDIDNDFINNNICLFDVNFLLEENDHFNESIENYIQDYIQNISSCTQKGENEYQNVFDELMLKLLCSFHGRTSLSYLNTRNKNYLEGKSPNCTFIFNDININIKNEYQCLQDFVVIIGNIKEPTESIDDIEAKNEILMYLKILLNKQDRNKIYGFLTNNKCIKFFCVKKNSDFYLYDYFESPTLNMFDYLFNVTPSMKMFKTNTSFIEESKNISLNKETWIIFTKFLIMHKDFYEYTTLNINDIHTVLSNRYSIMKTLGKCSTSNFYLLEKTKNNIYSNDTEHCIIKIYRHNEYSSLYLNEIKIIKELKKLNISNNFNLFFEDVISLSFSGNFLLFKNELESIKALPLIQSKQLIDIIQYLYDSNIIHRDLCPQNLMLDGHIQQLKLIDFSFASQYEKNEITKQLSINGTISFAGHEFLYFISNLSLDSIKSQFYAYERNFDLKSALHLIIYMNDNNIQLKMKSIQKLKYFIDEATQTLNLWKILQHNNKYYSNLLTLIDSPIQSSTFKIIKKEIEKFVYT
ncbi:unnamed protein product [Rotaria sordida]|uniref:Protein kinase domain-containing protein n=1 Tax=Rotaria sordida TaxID=392033 RepID=A0A814DGC6_9BILA|nr:unnamed protein product [Rotaria sordida]